jgi:hypothetical protein
MLKGRAEALSVNYRWRKQRNTRGEERWRVKLAVEASRKM